MTGALLQLVAMGNQDTFFNGNPQISFFKCVYKKYSNFAIESKFVNFDSVQYLNYEQPTRLFVNLPKYGDLLSKIYFEFTLPDIYSSIDNKFKWIDSIGTSIINYVKFYINDTLIEKIEGEYISIYFNNLLSDDKLNTYNQIIGNIDDVKRTRGKVDNKYFAGKFNQNIPTIIGRKIIVPIPLWFTKYRGQELPVISLDKSKIQVEIELKAINKLYTVIEKKQLILENSLDIDGNVIDHSGEQKIGKNNEILYDNNTINYEQRKAPFKKTDEIKYFLESNENNFWPLKPKLNIEYVYLDEQERKIIKSMDHQYLIERVQNSEFIGLYNAETIELRLFNPTKELYIVPYRDDIIENNQFTNFSNLDYKGQEENIYNYQNHLLEVINTMPNKNFSKLGLFRTDRDKTADLKIDKNELNIDEDRYIESEQAFTIDDISEILKIWNYRDINDIPAITADNYRYFTSNIVESIEIKFNGDIRQASRENTYYENIVPYMCHSNRQDGVLVYSFSLEPEKYQPSGACNFSNIKDAILEIKFKNTTLYESEGKKNVKYNIKIYNTTYNILKIYDNTCQLLFST
tara:strand:+ start:6821 stop:8545 length:1725 start_codon:yes stop_codon:yes gene_type:complete